MTAKRFHLTLTAAKRPAMHGWWGSETVARAKFTPWIGRGGDVRVVLVDEQAVETLAEWPEAVL
ncbi:hypothetical protein [Streptomyces sp. NPDC094149]|uniref:hypothetical protein n=1 Tax=Streptomyces sp. NPDC094149 TaxID=3155079 RepID=UPI003327905B